MWIEASKPTSPDVPVRFTVASFVNKDDQYRQMRATFEAHGFTEPTTQYLVAREATNAFPVVNQLLAMAKGEFVIFCHQDVRLIGDGAAQLAARLDELGRVDPNWALAGNAGGLGVGRLALRITDPHGADSYCGELPARVVSLDENFFVMRREVGLRCSRDLEGFHLYATDLCLIADTLGYSAWVIDFHLHHLSDGSGIGNFDEYERKFRAKWSRALRPRWIQTPSTLFWISGGGRLAELPQRGARYLEKVSRRWPGASGWVRTTSADAKRV